MTISVGFETTPLGAYLRAAAQADWGAVRLHDFNEERTEIVTGGAGGEAAQALRVFYPLGAIRPPHSGTEFKVRLDDADEAYCDYRVFFEPGFDFRKGGKLPGLAGGKANSGGHPSAGDGWSARFMWKERGRLILYLYHMHQSGDFGDVFDLGTPPAVPGRWYRLTLQVRVNAPGMRNGFVRVWVDGALALDLHSIAFRSGDAAPVDRFLFSTFFGGSTPDWGPHVDCHARFDDFTIGPDRPQGLEDAAG